MPTTALHILARGSTLVRHHTGRQPVKKATLGDQNKLRHLLNQNFSSFIHIPSSKNLLPEKTYQDNAARQIV